LSVTHTRLPSPTLEDNLAATRPPESGTLLVIDDDEVTLRLLKVNLERAGYLVRMARTGAEGLVEAAHTPPELILADALLPDQKGVDVCRALMASSRTRHVPVILMSSQTSSREVVAALEAGADDYVIKPLDYAQVLARVRAHIRRAQLKPALNPLTGLPGNLIIEHEIRRLVAPGQGLFAVLYADFNDFKPYNDVYGFPAGDEAIRLLARVMVAAVAELGNPSDLVGHVGGDDFVILTTPDRGDALAQRVIADFDRAAPQLYSPADRRRGYLTGKDRQGMIKKFPLLSVAIAIVHNQFRPVSSHWEVGEVGAELKRFAKTRPGSAYVKDQRRV
jgi:PleD family two-component response regulator